MMDMHLGSQTGASPGDRVDPGTSAKRARARGRNERGTALVEFAVVFPLLVTLLLGIIEFGVVFSNDVALTNAASLGAQLLSISRGQTLDPCMTTSGAVYAAAPNLAPGSLQFTIVLNGVTVTSAQANPSCSSSTTTTGAAANLVPSASAVVTVTYPCNLQIMGFNPAPNCTLTAQTTEAIQ
jgi:Flp pilus assembly protein TadG